MGGLKMWQHVKFVVVPSVFDKLFTDKLRGCQEQVNAFLVSSQPAVRIRFRRQHRPALDSRITRMSQGIPEPAAFTGLARFPLQYQVVGGTEQLEIVNVIHDWD